MHHVRPLNDHGARHALGNLVTVCKDCHVIVHQELRKLTAAERQSWVRCMAMLRRVAARQSEAATAARLSKLDEMAHTASSGDRATERPPPRQPRPQPQPWHEWPSPPPLRPDDRFKRAAKDFLARDLNRPTTVIQRVLGWLMFSMLTGGVVVLGLVLIILGR